MPSRPHAIAALILATAGWGLSFPLMKALTLWQQQACPGASTPFLSAWGLGLRFLIATLALAVLLGYRRLAGLTRKEGRQAVELGVYTALGLGLQMDGLNYTLASTSAFLTQGYVVFLPVWLALASHRLPALRIWAAVALVLAGAVVLTSLDWRDLSLGRGELETLGAALVFTVQILAVESPRFAGNDSLRMSVAAFAVTALLLLPIGVLLAPSPTFLWQTYASWPAVGILLVLALVPTLMSMALMFTYQRHVGATAAAITYCCEPVFASGFALVLPGLLSLWMGVSYANETITAALLVGGALVLAAVALVQMPGAFTRAWPDVAPPR